MIERTKFYGVFYRSNYRWTGPYGGDMYREDQIEEAVRDCREITKSRVEVRQLAWVPLKNDRNH